MLTFPKELDSALEAFCTEHRLHLATVYRDTEVRSISVVDDQASPYQIWIDIVEQSWVVRVSDNISRQSEFMIIGNDYSGALREAYRVIDAWIKSDGHTRSAAS